MKMLFSNKVFRVIMVTDFIQQMCIWIRNMAVLLYIIDKTNSDPVSVSLVSVFEYLPMFVFSYIGGTMADRWKPRRTMILGDFFSAISVLGILLFVSGGMWKAIFAVTFISAVITQFSVPSLIIMLKANLEDSLITPAISFSQALQSLYIIAGPILGTAIFMKLGIQVSLITITVLFLISSGLQFLLPEVRRRKEETKKSVLGEMRQGFRFIKSSSSVKTLAAVLLVLGLAQGLIQPLTIYILENRLLLDRDKLQWFFAASGAGLLIGSGLAGVAFNMLTLIPVYLISAGLMLICSLLSWGYRENDASLGSSTTVTDSVS